MMRVNCKPDGAWREVEATHFHFCFPLPELVFSSGSFVSNGAHSCDRRERRKKASCLISAASRVLFSSSAQDLNLVLEPGAAKMGRRIFPSFSAHRCVCRLSSSYILCFVVGTLISGGGRLCSHY